LLLVSHDRYFIDRFAGRVWTIQDQHIADFKGGYQEYLAHLERKAQLKNAKPPAPEPTAAPKPDKPKRPGGTKYLEKEVAAAERAVAKAEEEMDELACAIDDAASDYLKLQELYEKREELENNIAHLYAIWEKLAAELEEAKGT